MAGDFVIPALELIRRGCFVSSFGVPWDGGRLSSSLGLAFTGIGRGGSGWVATGNWGLIAGASGGWDVGKTMFGGIRAGDLGNGAGWRYDGSTNCGGAGASAGIDTRWRGCADW